MTQHDATEKHTRQRKRDLAALTPSSWLSIRDSARYLNLGYERVKRLFDDNEVQHLIDNGVRYSTPRWLDAFTESREVTKQKAAFVKERVNEILHPSQSPISPGNSR